MKTILDAAVKEQLAKRIRSISGDEKALWGKMSVHQMICHSADQIRMSIGERGTKFVGNTLTQTLLKKLILWGMPAPKGKVETVPELKQGIGGTKPTSLDEDKDSLINLISGFDEKYPEGTTVRHPAFGEMNKKEWGRLVFIHADYHLRQFNK